MGVAGTEIARVHNVIRLNLIAIGGSYYRTEPYNFGKYAGGVLHTPANLAACVVQVCSGPAKANNLPPLNCWDRATTTMYTVQIGDSSHKLGPAKPYLLPVEIFGAGWVQFYLDNGLGVAVNQGGPLEFWFDVKG